MPDRKELSIPSVPFPVDRTAAGQEKTHFKERFYILAAGVYPEDALTRMREETYSPLLIGFLHSPEPRNIEMVTGFLEELKEANPGMALRVAHEIETEQLSYLRDFLRDEREFIDTGTIHGETPSATMVAGLRWYRQRLRPTEQFALWLLDHNFEVIPMTPEEISQWITEDEKAYPNKEGFSSYDEVQLERLALTAIRTDIHGLHVLDHERPDIVMVSSYHALKYHLLLDLNTERIVYLNTQPFDLERTFTAWEAAHAVYRNRKDSTTSLLI